MKRHSAGFTLIEILVALMIFAIMGVLAAMSLHSLLRTHEQLKKSDQTLLQLQVTMTLMRRDLMQVVDRSPGFLGSSGEIVFTRTGLSDPFDMSRQSNMQRVGYTIQKGGLARLTWNALNQPAKIKPESQIILPGVQSITWQFITDDGKKSSTWPLPKEKASSEIQANQSALPKVVLMVMHVKNEGVIQGVFPIPARGANATTQTTTTTP